MTLSTSKAAQAVFPLVVKDIAAAFTDDEVKVSFNLGAMLNTVSV